MVDQTFVAGYHCTITVKCTHLKLLKLKERSSIQNVSHDAFNTQLLLWLSGDQGERERESVDVLLLLCHLLPMQFCSTLGCCFVCKSLEQVHLFMLLLINCIFLSDRAFTFHYAYLIELVQANSVSSQTN